ncbi:hypothetical protein [Bdellovibrio sp. HCB274]|uniref:hypothetical protein n=1 Tax=Bdellovibrio sp. HCB274 TaxID=3394361 RepID=UPI0039B5966B
MLLLKRLVLIFILLPLWAQGAEGVETLPGNAEQLRGKPYPEFHKDYPPNKEKWEWSLPFLAQKATDRGIHLPRPYGVSLILTTLSQGVELSDLHVAFDPNKPLRDIDFVSLDGSTVQNSTWQLKADAWVLPFFNVFGLIGTVQGTGSVNVGISAKEFFDDFDPAICAGMPSFCQGYISAKAPMKYTGVNYGIGFLLAGGYHNFFFAMPVTYVVTDTNVSTSNSYSLNMIPRIGYNLQTPRSGKFGFYVGGNYLDSHADLTGTFSLPMASSPIGHDVNVQYSIHEHATDRWNGVVGTNWEISDLWSVVLELGYSENRTMQTIDFVYRL